MAGLIEKDMRLLWCNKLSVIAFVVFAVILEVSVKGAILGYLPFVMCLLMVNTIAYDEMDNGYQFLLTFPIDRKTYVREKYVLTLGMGVLSWGVAMVIYFVIKMIQGERLDMSMELPVTLSFLPVIALFILFMLPIADEVWRGKNEDCRGRNLRSGRCVYSRVYKVYRTGYHK